MGITQTMEKKVKLPSAKQLRECLWDSGFASFVCWTYIDNRLSDKELSLASLSNIVDTCIFQYAQILYDVTLLQSKHMGIVVLRPVLLDKGKILKCILCESPAEYKEVLALEKLSELNSRRSKL